VVSHIFKTDFIKLLSSIDKYDNPNIYEGVLQRQLSRVPAHIVSYKKSKVFGVPANRVNSTNPNRNGLKHPYTTKELNDMYLDGKIIKIKDYNINAAQQEIEYEFIHSMGR